MSLTKEVIRGIAERNKKDLQIVEMTEDEANALTHFPKDKYIAIKNEDLPLITDDLDANSTTTDITLKINQIIQALRDLKCIRTS